MKGVLLAAYFDSNWNLVFHSVASLQTRNALKGLPILLVKPLRSAVFPLVHKVSICLSVSFFLAMMALTVKVHPWRNWSYPKKSLPSGRRRRPILHFGQGMPGLFAGGASPAGRCGPCWG